MTKILGNYKSIDQRRDGSYRRIASESCRRKANHWRSSLAPCLHYSIGVGFEAFIAHGIAPRL